MQSLLIALLPSSLRLGATSSCMSLTCEEGEMGGWINQERKWDMMRWWGFGEVQDRMVGHRDGRKDCVGRWNPQGPWPCYDPRKWPRDLWNPFPRIYTSLLGLSEVPRRSMQPVCVLFSKSPMTLSLELGGISDFQSSSLWFCPLERKKHACCRNQARTRGTHVDTVCTRMASHMGTRPP